jgi:hypothetical protein
MCKGLNIVNTYKAYIPAITTVRMQTRTVMGAVERAGPGGAVFSEYHVVSITAQTNLPLSSYST